VVFRRGGIGAASLRGIVQTLGMAVAVRKAGEECQVRTFFVMMKLVPMASELDIAKASPMYLSSTMSAMYVVGGMKEVDREAPVFTR